MYPQKVKHLASGLVSPHKSNTHILLDHLGLSYFIDDIKSNLQLSFGHLHLDAPYPADNQL